MKNLIFNHKTGQLLLEAVFLIALSCAFLALLSYLYEKGAKEIHKARPQSGGLIHDTSEYSCMSLIKRTCTHATTTQKHLKAKLLAFSIQETLNKKARS